ncbi:UNVERIFIED_CONTAM: hypothetical protein Sradi_0812600 [Sesamum radiatum]|uniref:Uncharacterized protein n=1 Tax=Sesamum radiatum TaxID=300843 RepID=A0AAW2VU42_SESRA
MNLIGPFPPNPGQRKFVIVAVDHFTKWVEAEPSAKITENAVIQFIWKNLNLKTKIGKIRTGWVDELLGVLWAYRTTPKTSTGDTPFALAYGSKALIPAKVIQSTSRVICHEEGNNEAMRRLELDLIEERRHATKLRMENYKRKAIRRCNTTVKERMFQVGDLVLKKVEVQRVAEKLEPIWEGLYQIKSVQIEGMYKLMTIDGQEVPRTWAVQNLKKFYC